MFFRQISPRIDLVVVACLLLVAAALGGLAVRTAAAQPATPASPTLSAAAVSPSAVVIPDFWDPRRRVERPPPGTVQALRFITTDDFPPFNFLDSDGHLTGFNVDLARAICAKLAIPCTIQARAWSELANRVADKTADAAIAGIAITGEARAQLDFSDVYLRTPARFVVRRADAGLQPTPEGLKGKTLAVVEHTAHEAYLAAMFPEVARKLYPTADAAREAVAKGEADAHFGDGLQLSFWLQSEGAAGCCVFAGGPYLESRFFGQGYAIAVAKGQTDTKRAIDAALQSLYEKGVYAELYLRYFPVGFF
jgi:polar amino acid transport system substrate-binding protein